MKKYQNEQKRLTMAIMAVSMAFVVLSVWANACFTIKTGYHCTPSSGQTSFTPTSCDGVLVASCQNNGYETVYSAAGISAVRPGGTGWTFTQSASCAAQWDCVDSAENVHSCSVPMKGPKAYHLGHVCIESAGSSGGTGGGKPQP